MINENSERNLPESNLPGFFLRSELEKFIASVSEIVVVVVDQDHHYPIIKNLMAIY